MRTAEVKRLTREAFRPFGDFAALIGPQGERIGEPPVEFYRDMLPLRLGVEHDRVDLRLPGRQRGRP